MLFLLISPFFKANHLIFKKLYPKLTSVNNLFDVYPDEIETGGDFVTDLGGRFRYPWEVNQFGFNGTILKIGADFTF